MGGGQSHEADGYDPSKDPVDMSTLEGQSFPYENLVLEGGGAKACAYSGAFEVLEKAGILKNIKRIAGTSGGAIAGTLLALGCSPKEVEERFQPCWDDFKDARFGSLSYLWNAFSILGFNPGNQALTTIQQNIADKMDGNADLTFQELYDKRGIELCIVATNLSAMAIQYFHPKTTPHAKIAEAVRMSISIPVMMAPFKRVENNRESLYVDGGVLCNYPIHAFDGWFLSMDDKDSFFRKLRNGRERWFDGYNSKTLGICVYQTGEIDSMKMHVHQYDPDHSVKRPDTELSRQRSAESDRLLKEMNERTELLRNVDVIFENVRTFDVDNSGSLSKEEMINSYRNASEELIAAHKVVYGEDYDPKKFIARFEDGQEATFQMFIDYLQEKRGIGLEDLTESVDYMKIEGVKDYFTAIVNTWQMAGAGRYNMDFDSDRTIGVYTDYVGTMDLSMDQLDLEFLRRQARVATVQFLNYVIEHGDPNLTAARNSEDVRLKPKGKSY